MYSILQIIFSKRLSVALVVNECNKECYCSIRFFYLLFYVLFLLVFTFIKYT